MDGFEKGKALSAQDVRFASNLQLSEIFQVHQNVSQRWVSTATDPSVRVLRRGEAYGLTVAQSLEGIRLRRKDWEKRKLHKDAVNVVLLSGREVIAS